MPSPLALITGIPEDTSFFRSGKNRCIEIYRLFCFPIVITNEHQGGYDLLNDLLLLSGVKLP